MSQSVSEISNISSNILQVLTVDDYELTLRFSPNMKRWFIGIEGVFDGDKIVNKTELLKEYNLGFTITSVSDDDNLGAYEVDAYTESGNSSLYIIREE